MMHSWLKALSLFLILSFCGRAGAQTTPATESAKKWNHALGVQINELIRQVFNFSGTTATSGNPYLLIYNLNRAASGWGLRAGLGFTYRSFTDGDAVTERVSDINEVRARFGLERRFALGNRFTAGAGVDGVFSRDDNTTRSVLRSSFDTTTTLTKSNVDAIGGGPMAWLRYSITPQVTIGTEASFYYQSGTESGDILITRRDQNVPGRPYITKRTLSETDTRDGRFALPVAFFLLVNF